MYGRGTAVQRSVMDSTQLLQRLELDVKLDVHNGCVNTIGKIIFDWTDIYDMSKARHLQQALWTIPPLSGGPLYKVLAASLYGQGISLTQAHYDQHGRVAVSTIFKCVGMTQIRTRDIPIQIRVGLYWAKSALI